jgi:thiamine biosynthesis protein ThiS
VRVTINGEARELPKPMTIAELAAFLGLDGPVAVEVNRAIVPRAEHAARSLAEGDVLEIVHMVGGG